MPDLGQVIEVTPSPNHLAFACHNGIVFVFEISDLTKVKCKLEPNSTSACVSVDFNPSVELVVLAGQTDGTLTTWGHAS
jgi:WD40 repeat protein